MGQRTLTVNTYTIEEAATKLGVTRMTLWRAVQAGKLSQHKERGRVWFEADDLLEYVLQHMGGRGIEDEVPGA
jgi:excisionase family DNA binding protein